MSSAPNPLTGSLNVTSKVIGPFVGSAWPAAGAIVTVGGSSSNPTAATAEAVVALPATSSPAPATTCASNPPTPVIPLTAMSYWVTEPTTGLPLTPRPLPTVVP